MKRGRIPPIRSCIMNTLSFFDKNRRGEDSDDLSGHFFYFFIVTLVFLVAEVVEGDTEERPGYQVPGHFNVYVFPDMVIAHAELKVAHDEVFDLFLKALDARFKLAAQSDPHPEDDIAEVRVISQELERMLDAEGQVVDGRDGRQVHLVHFEGDVFFPVVVIILYQRDENVILVLEILVYGAPGYLGVVDDIRDLGVVIPFLGKQVFRPVKDQLLPFNGFHGVWRSPLFAALGFVGNPDTAFDMSYFMSPP